jgi:hypothetical protein
LTDQVPQIVRADCERAAREMSESVVYCPPLVPKGPARSQNRSSRGRGSITARGGAYQLHFVSPSLQRRDPGNPGRIVHLGHWTFSAFSEAGLSRHDPLRTQSFRALTRGEGVRPVGQRAIDGVPVTLMGYAENAYSVHSGHLLAVWALGSRAYNVSLHGWEHRSALLAMAEALIRQIRACPPAVAERAGVGCTLVFPASP